MHQTKLDYQPPFRATIACIAWSWWLFATLLVSANEAPAATQEIDPSSCSAMCSDVVERLLNDEEPQLKIGYPRDSVPFSSSDGLAPRGFAIDVCAEVERGIHRGLRAVWSRNNVTRGEFDQFLGPARFIELESDKVFESIEDGTVDFVCGPITITRERMARFAFSRPFFATGAVALVNLDSVVGSEALEGRKLPLSSLARMRVGVIERTSSAAFLQNRSYLPDEPCTESEDAPCLDTIERHADAARRLRRKEIDVLIGDREIVLWHQRRKPGFDAEDYAISEPFTFEPYAIPMRRNEHRLRCLIDWALSDLFEKYKDADVEYSPKDDVLGIALRNLWPSQSDREPIPYRNLPLLLQGLYSVSSIPSTGKRSRDAAGACIEPL